MSTLDGVVFLVFGGFIHTFMWYFLPDKNPAFSRYLFGLSFVAGFLSGILSGYHLVTSVSQGIAMAMSYIVSFLITRHIVPGIRNRFTRS